MTVKKLTFNDLVTASGKYPERLNSPHLTEEVKTNLKTLRSALILLLEEIGVAAKVSSGFRPPEVNSKIEGASKKSLHTRGLAVDLEDKNGVLKRIISGKPHLLAKYKLWMEDTAVTPGWCHLDLGSRPDRPVRIFKP